MSRSADSDRGAAAGGGQPQAVERRNLAALAYDDLRARLRNGLVAPEDRLVDLEIARELGMSRMPVREALLRLVSEGYLASTARGYRLPTLSLPDVTEIFEVRRLLEPRAAALAARDASRATLARLDTILRRARKAAALGDFSRLFRANVEFRAAWLSAVRNGRMVATISRFADQVQTVSHGTLRDPAIQHLAIERLDELNHAFASHDSVLAQDSMLRFIDAAERSFVARHARDAGSASAAPRPSPVSRHAQSGMSPLP